MSTPNPKAFPLANAQLTNQVRDIISREGNLSYSSERLLIVLDPRFGSASFSLQAVKEGVSHSSTLSCLWDHLVMGLEGGEIVLEQETRRISKIRGRDPARDPYTLTAPWFEQSPPHLASPLRGSSRLS